MFVLFWFVFFWGGRGCITEVAKIMIVNISENVRLQIGGGGWGVKCKKKCRKRGIGKGGGGGGSKVHKKVQDYI